jgi:hypothetical protein
MVGTQHLRTASVINPFHGWMQQAQVSPARTSPTCGNDESEQGEE